MYSNILFDLDGTLTDSKPGIVNCVQYALEKMGLPVPEKEALNRYVGPPLHKSFEKFAGLTPEKAMEAVEIYRERFSTIGLFENEVYAGVISLLEEVKKSGKTLAIATSKPTVYTVQILEHFDLAKYFTVIVGSEMDGSRTDKAEVIEEVLKQLGKPDKDKTLMIGDREHDIIGARKMGLHSIGVLYGYSEGDELAEAGVDVVLNTVTELKKYLLEH